MKSARLAWYKHKLMRYAYYLIKGDDKYELSKFSAVTQTESQHTPKSAHLYVVFYKSNATRILLLEGDENYDINNYSACKHNRSAY